MIINDCFKVRRFILAAAFLAGLGCGIKASAQERSYLIDLNSKTVTELATLGGNDRHIATSINDLGQVVGWASAPGGSEHAFITAPNGRGIRDLGTLGGTYSMAQDINDAGQVVGWTYIPEDEHEHAFITGPNGMGMRDLGILARSGFLNPIGINDSGQVTGVFMAEGYHHAFITGPNGMGMRALGTLGGTSSVATDINNAGQVAGSSDYITEDAYHSHAFITGVDGMGMRDLGTLGGTFDGPGPRYYTGSSASGINDAGQVVGESNTAKDGPPVPHAFITAPNGVGMRDLGTLGGTHSEAAGINDAGQVVGWSFTSEGGSDAPEGGRHAFVTGPNGVDMMDLNSLVDLPDGVILTYAYDINNAGQVIATAPIAPTLIPEPEIYALFLAGLTLVGFVARRKKSEIRI